MTAGTVSRTSAAHSFADPLPRINVCNCCMLQLSANHPVTVKRAVGSRDPYASGSAAFPALIILEPKTCKKGGCALPALPQSGEGVWEIS
jgi:hypothetical protein